MDEVTRRPRGRTPLGAILAGALVLALAAPAVATHGGIHPTFRTEPTFFHCNEPTKVENVNLIFSGPTTWDTNPPEQSVQEGAGCGSLDPGVFRGGNPGTIYDAVFEGFYVGNLRDMTIELHNLLLSRARAGETFTVRVRMLIDGVEIFPETAGKFVEVTPEVSSTGLSEKFLFSIPDLGCAQEVLDENGDVVDVVTDGLATEDGDGATERFIQLAIDSGAIERNGAWVWDTTEVPSGITFNPEALAEAQVAPTDPADCGAE